MDMTRPVIGSVPSMMANLSGTSGTAALRLTRTSAGTLTAGGTYDMGTLSLDTSRTGPVGAANKPRAWGALACAYLGQPA